MIACIRILWIAGFLLLERYYFLQDLPNEGTARMESHSRLESYVSTCQALGGLRCEIVKRNV